MAHLEIVQDRLHNIPEVSVLEVGSAMQAG